MDIKIKYWFMFLLLASSVASAQKNIVIYHVSGIANIIEANKTTEAKRGDILLNNKSLQVKNNSSCMLVISGGKSMLVSDAGTYSFEALLQLFKETKINEITKKFFAYVYDNFFTSNKTQAMGVTPVVFRGEKLMLLPSDNSIILSDEITFLWKKPVIKTPVRLTITDDAGKILLDSIIKKANSLQINLAETGIVPKHIYQWKMEESDTHQPKNYFLHFLVADKKHSKKILSDLNLLRDKKLSAQLKQQMQQDIFEKWKVFYAGKNE